MRLKINLTSGSVLEKNLLAAFKTATGSYIILDAEKTDSTGLPVIMVSKLQDNNVSNIIDANEWASVKDNLRSIVSGTATEFINVNPELNGDDAFYKQLTLPVAYFDTLKSIYNPPQTASAPQVEPVSTPQPEITPAPEVSPMANINITPEMPSVDNSQVAQPTVDTPVVSPEMPQMPDINAMAVEPQVTTQESTIEASTASSQLDFAQEKENFLKACENMFDALVTKINK